MGDKRDGTKQKIVHVSIDLFSKKGFTETSVREIAAAVGVNEASLYNHFDSKYAILEHILEYYRQTASAFRAPEEALARLTKDATTDDVLACLILHYPEEDSTYLLKILQVLFQEQLRNEAVRNYIVNDMILWSERHVSDLLQRLITSGALDRNTDVDFWTKLNSALNCKFSTHYVLGIGEMHPGFMGKGIMAMKRKLYDTLFLLHGTKK